MNKNNSLNKTINSLEDTFINTLENNIWNNKLSSMSSGEINTYENSNIMNQVETSIILETKDSGINSKKAS